MDFNDYLAYQNNYGQTTTARFLLGAGEIATQANYNFILDVYNYHNDGSAQLDWTSKHNPSPTINFSTDLIPKVTAQPLAAFTGQPATGVVATFTPSAPGTTAADSGTIQPNTDGTFSVMDAHTFTAAGSQQGTITVAHTASGFTGTAAATSRSSLTANWNFIRVSAVF